MKATAQARNTYKNEDLYATDKDFCEIFKAEMTGLYSLALLLTGSRVSAEQCFVAALKDSVSSHGVFKELAPSWSRRAIIKHAVQMIRPLPIGIEGGPGTGQSFVKSVPDLHIPVAGIMALEPFERFAFVMSVLEGYTVQDCATLLNSTRQEVITARARALQQLLSVGRHTTPPLAIGAEILEAQETLPLDAA